MRTAPAIIFIMMIIIGLRGYSQPVVITDQSHQEWKYSDVRLIDPVEASVSALDIVAIYSKLTTDALIIRIDFVKLTADEDVDLSIFIDNQPGGSDITSLLDTPIHSFKWDAVIHLSESNGVEYSTYQLSEIINYKARASVNINQSYIEIIIGISDQNINLKMARMIAVSRSSTPPKVIDYTEPAPVLGSPPPPINVSFLFWNIMDSSSPATILRSWAGAHTGPQSTRHGLLYLLQASLSWNIPISICDFYDRDNIMALRYIQKLTFINDAINSGLIININKCDWNGYTQPAIQLVDSYQILSDTSLFCIDMLIRYFSEENSSFIYLGGDFTSSILGTPEAINALLSYIASHPWIKVVSYTGSPVIINIDYFEKFLNLNQDLIPYSIIGKPFPSGITTSEIRAQLNAKLSILPNNEISGLIDIIVQNILESDVENIRAEQGSYLNQLGHIIQAANWADNPVDQITCDDDIDWDGTAECILSSTNIFLSFELEGGYLAFAFIHNSSGFHQIIGPTTQFPALRSDPLLIIPSTGIASDPGQIIGAFADPLSTIRISQGYPNSNQLELISKDGHVRKLFSIQDSTIHVVIDNAIQDESRNVILPLVLDPWLIYSQNPQDLYWEDSSLIDWTWGIRDQFYISIHSTSEYTHNTFNATYNALMIPEDPNYDYTLGHLLPIPMAVVKFPSLKTIEVEIVIN